MIDKIRAADNTSCCGLYFPTEINKRVHFDSCDFNMIVKFSHHARKFDDIFTRVCVS